jgi:hypothetical protein
VRKRILAGGLAIVSSVCLPYAWQGVQEILHFFSGLRSDLTALKIDQAQLKGQVTQIQDDLEVIIGREIHGLTANQGKEGVR